MKGGENNMNEEKRIFKWYPILMLVVSLLWIFSTLIGLMGFEPSGGLGMIIIFIYATTNTALMVPLSIIILIIILVKKIEKIALLLPGTVILSDLVVFYLNLLNLDTVEKLVWILSSLIIVVVSIKLIKR